MKRSKGGFSLAELLTVVAILAVLAAVAVPALAAISSNLKLRELDDTARGIFLAAQNTLTARKADGTLAKPEGEVIPEQGVNCYWLFDEAAEFLLPDGAVDPTVAENHIAIWYNADSAMVLEVYYGEKDGSFASPACAWDKDDIQKERNYSGADKAGARKSSRIGYYDDADGVARGGVVQLLPPTLEIVNGDELTVRVTVPRAGEYYTNGVTLTVTVEGPDANDPPAEKTVEFPKLKYSTLDGTYELVLDSLTDENQQFKKVCSGIVSGADIRVTAELSASESETDGTKYLSARASAAANSLFAERSGNTVSVACARHLQNLNVTFSQVAVSPEQKIEVRQIQNIDWSKTGAAYQPIENALITSYEGQGLEIRGLNGSLFDNAAENIALNGIRIVNPTVSGSGRVGALANTATNAEIKDCRVYATTLDRDATGQQKENFTRLQKDFAVKSTDGAAGGLIGSATDCTIFDSFAALSEVSGSTAGGLIGIASGCTIENCYATVENLSGSDWSALFIGNISGGTVTHCYAAGNLCSTGGTVSGFANGSGTISTSYCAASYNKEDGTPAGINPNYGFAAGGAATCAYLAVNTPTATDEAAKPLSYGGLKIWGSGWQALTAAQTHPYREDLAGQAYPFPGLKDSGGQVIPHYGSWPVQTVQDIKLYSSQSGEDEIKMILVPKNGAATVWAQPDYDSEVSVQVRDAGEEAITASAEKSDDPARTKITVTSTNNQTGVTYADITAGGYTLRAVIVVYEGSIELSSSGGLDEGRKTASDDYLGNAARGYLALSSENSSKRTAVLTTAFINLAPLDPKSGFDALYGADPTANWSTDGGIFENWAKVKDGYPVISPELDPVTGTQVLTTEQQTDGSLKVIGTASGTVQAIAEWAMNGQLPEERQLTARMDVQMKGARALINTASASPCLNGEGGTVTKSGYPYQLDLTAEPGENITLTFTPHLFNGPEANTPNDRYTWEIYRVNEDGSRGDQVGSSKTTQPDAGTESGTYMFTLTEHSANARYLVLLTYENDDTQEQSADYMYFSVYRSAKKAEQASEDIRIVDGAENPLNGVSLGNGSAADAKVEQQHSESYPMADVLTLQGYVQGAANTQTQWAFSVDGINWTPITGHVGPQAVWESVTANGKETQRMRASVEWNYNNQQLADGTATGGSITVTGLDANEYEKPFTFQLKAEAVESNGTNGSAYQIITVAVMNKLQIDPQSKVLRYWRDPEPGSFQANRTANSGSYVYEWYVDGSKVEGEAESSCTVSGVQGTRKVELRWGPYTASAVLTNKYGGDGFTSNINWDKEADDKQYFFVEKGTSRTMEFSWGTNLLDYHRIIQHPSTTSVVGIIAGSGDSEYVLSGTYDYTVTGLTFNRNNAEEMTWTFQKLLLLGYGTRSVTHYVYVIGMDIKKDDEVLSDTGETLNLELGVPITLTADWSFPQAFMDSTMHSAGKPDIQWEISNTELVDFADGNDAGESVRLEAKKYSTTGYTTTVKATCTVHCTNGQDYTFIRYVQVEVEPTDTLALSVTPCGSADVEELRKCFEEVTADTVLAARDGTDGPLVLVHDAAFGCNRMYLKVSANGDLTPYLWNISCDQFFVDMKCVQSRTDTSVLYVRLETKAANVKPVDLSLTVSIGKANVVPIPILLCDAPTIYLKDGSGTDVTNGSLPVYQDHQNAALVTLSAGLSPDLRNAETGAQLDSIKWTMEALSAGYFPADYLEMETASDGTVTVRLRESGRLPDFRVIIRAQSSQSERSAAGYALVFLPEDMTGSESMPRRKRTDSSGE